jgi:radical SAM superfamily enzyme YgiQ (UPF0313 family)
MSKIVLVDLQSKEGFVNKDTVAGGYGSRFKGFSSTTRIIEIMKKIYQNLPSIQLGYLAALFAAAGHEVKVTRGPLIAGDVALVLTSIVDYRNEIRWAEQAKAQFGLKIGFFSTFATHMPSVFADHGDFVIRGEPEHAAMALARGETLQGIVDSPFIQDLDSLPFPRWDLVHPRRFSYAAGQSMLPARAAFPLLSSRSCPEFCTYCPHRITAKYRARSPENVLAEIEEMTDRFGKIYLVFRDPLFTEERERSLAIAEGIISRRLPVLFSCETRLDDLDRELIDFLHRAGLRSITFGVEAVDPQILRRVARRPIPPEHQKQIVAYCRQKGIVTTGFYVFGFLHDTVESIEATIDYAVELDSAMAQFKILTPYPGTPLRKQMEHLIHETDWQRFDGYTPTFQHPNLTREQMINLLITAYARFYFRPSWLFNYLGVHDHFERWVAHWDSYAERRHKANAAAVMSGEVS